MTYGETSKFRERAARQTAELSALEAEGSETRAAVAEAESFSTKVLTGIEAGTPPQPPPPAQQRAATDADSQSGVARSLRYYTGGRGGEPRLPQQLTFNEPSGDIQVVELRSEAARLATFQAADAEAAELAAAGFYSDGGRDARCAFCRGHLGPRQPGESAMAAHIRQFCTCPFVLRLDVGNVPMSRDESLVSGCLPAVQCSEDCCSAWESETETRAHDWQQRSGLGPSEAAAVLTSNGPPAVSAGVTAAAAAPNAVDNLEALEACAADVPPLWPKLQNQTMRLRSFSTDHECSLLMPSADVLAEAGFSLLTRRRLVCFSCGLRLLHCQAHEDPWVAHAAWSPRCAHLLLNRGAAFVRAARASMLTVIQAAADATVASMAYSSPGDHVLDDAAFSDSDAGAVLRFRNGPRDVRARFDRPMLRDAQRIFGASRGASSEIRALIELRLTLCGNDFASPEQLLASALLLRSERLSQNLEAEDFLANRLLRLQSDWPTEAPALTDADAAWRSCKVCLDRRVDVLLQDCGHFCCCSRCSRNLAACPICRAEIRAELLVRL